MSHALAPPRSSAKAVFERLQLRQNPRATLNCTVIGARAATRSAAPLHRCDRAIAASLRCAGIAAAIRAELHSLHTSCTQLRKPRVEDASAARRRCIVAPLEKDGGQQAPEAARDA